MVTSEKSLVKSNISPTCDNNTTKNKVPLHDESTPIEELLKSFPGTNWAKLSHRDDNRPISFITESEVYALCDQAKTGSHGSRNEALLLLLFQGCMRISEALDIRLRDLGKKDGMYLLLIEHGKGDKSRLIAIPDTLYHRIRSYANEAVITDPDERIFKISRFQALRIAKSCAVKAGINRRVYCHLFRHGGSVKRLMATGNLKSLQMFLGHSDSKMTMRYQRTMQTIQALEVESKVSFER